MPLLIIILIILLLFGAKILPRLGHYVGAQSRKPYRQAKWMWSSFAGTEEESIKAEREYGRECAREFIRQFPDAVPAADQELVAGIGDRLSAQVNDSRREFRFALVSSSTANAFALPGGFVFMTNALLELCKRDRDEIAFFLGHEIGHIVHGHAREQMATSTLLSAVTARLAGAGSMIREVLGKGYSRTLELEADAEAIRLAAAADFDSGAAVRALQRLSQVAPDNAGLAEYFSSHPSIAERVREIKDRR